MHQGYPGHLALFCEMWKLWLGEKVSPYLEKNPTHHHPSQIWPLHSKWSVISVTEKSKAGGNFLSKKMKSNCKWVYLKWKRQHFHSKCILLKMQTCQACKLSIWIDQTKVQIWYFPYLSSKGIVFNMRGASLPIVQVNAAVMWCRRLAMLSPASRSRLLCLLSTAFLTSATSRLLSYLPPCCTTSKLSLKISLF